METVARHYNNLEYDLEKGKRGSRLVHAEALLCRLTGAEAALVVNNNASAVMLALAALANRRRVLVARTQLVEIGGSFRVPDIMKQSGAKLVEIGTTNRVHLRDYEQALREQPIHAVLRAHRSNFRLVGFTTEPTLAEIVRVAQAYDVPVIDDLGSGVLLDTRRYGLAYEPRVQDSLAAGADLVCFSGDKLLGGPQAGILLGRARLMTKLKKHPLARALRVEKTRLAALIATLQHYLKEEAERAIPIWQMIAADPKTLQARAAAWVQALGYGEVVPVASAIGGGSLPGETLPSFALALPVRKPAALAARLRAASPPVIARIRDGLLLFDPRTVFPEQESALLRILADTLSTEAP
jgi:L-seryl-tRNA(Ser) seleniumtransferase